jgi:hypothetical protein
MKTTVELPDALLIAAKKRAAESWTTLREILERGLRRELGQSRRQPRLSPRPIRWVTVKGGIPEGLDVSDRAKMHDWLRKRARGLVRPGLRDRIVEAKPTLTGAIPFR